MMKQSIAFALICSFTISLWAQTFKGRVVDLAGNPIPYAALYLKELKTGFTTDDNGCFQTSLPAGQYTCEVSSLGFAGQTFSFSISAGDVEKNIVLSEQIYSLREVNVVKGVEDPAYSVMRKAIANAPYYRTQVKGFRAGTYLKGTGKMKTIPAILKLSKEVRKAWIGWKGLPSYVSEYNFVDGFWLGAKFETGLKLSEASTLRFTPSAYYTTARKAVAGQSELSLSYAPRRRGYLELSGGVLSADYNGESGESRLINTVASSFFGRNDVKLYEKRFLSFQNKIELANSLLLSTSLSWQRRQMLENHIHRSWFKKEAESNIPDSRAFYPMPENELLKASFALEYTPAHYYRMYRGKKVYEESKCPTFTLRYDRAFPLKGALPSPSYHLAEFSARQSIEFGMFNTLDWAVNAGTFWNKSGMQFPDFKHFATTGLPVTERSFDTGFSLLDNYAYSTNTRWVQANISWYTPCLLLKFLPFLKKKNLDEALHLRTLVEYDRRPYSEIGYSIGFMKLARLGVFLGFDSLKYRSAGVSVSIPLSTFAGE